VADVVLALRAERRQEQREAHRSEFRYGVFERTVALPDNANTEDVTATYESGVLTVSVGLAEPRMEDTKRISVTVK